MSRVRMPAVAGTFYPANKDELIKSIDESFSSAVRPHDLPPGRLKAVISPHAGFIYSGPIAATGFSLLTGKEFKRVVVIGPSHRVSFRGVAAPDAQYFRTPLGDVEIDMDEVNYLKNAGLIIIHDRPHTQEHSIEVQLPFLQKTLKPGFKFVPLSAGNAEPDEISKILARYWDDDDSLIVISSDLSHYETYDEARLHDKKTADNIVGMNYSILDFDDACGLVGIRGLLKLASERKTKISCLDLRSSGDTAGDRSQVVGYGCFGVFQESGAL